MRVIRLLHGACLAAGVALIAGAGCQTQPTEASLRALEQSGRVSFVCLGDPADGSPALPLKKCRNVRAEYACDYGLGGGGEGGTGGGGGGADGDGDGGGSSSSSSLPHLYGLVTQTFRGEVAVIDLTTSGGDYLVDQDPSVPGPTFLPIGGQPVGIVSTPGSTATFVTVAEVGKEGIYAIPSARLLRSRNKDSISECTVAEEGGLPPPDLTSWPACSLRSAPGEPFLIVDPADDQGFERASCDADYAHPDAEITGANGDLHPEWRDLLHPHGVLRDEGPGRQKIVVPLPAEGVVAVIDAQAVLDGYRTPPDPSDPDAAPGPSEGVFAPCPIERWIPLDDEVPTVAPPEPPKGAACISEVPDSPTAVTGSPMPGGMAFGEGTLYVSDLTLPLIHRLAMDSPCEPLRLPSLLPTSVDDPRRVVTTSRVAVTPRPTADLKRYLYANDVDHGTVMVFDVSDGSTSRTPLQRPHPEWTPAHPRDRLRFGAAVRDILILSRDVPRENGSGVAPEGTLCNPDPDALTCASTDAICDVGTLYRPASDLTSGAGPFNLRGTFAFVLLTNGQLQVVDIEDFDAPCRGPAAWSELYGCEPPTCTKDRPCPANFTCPSFDEDDPDDTVHTCEQETNGTAVKPFASTNELSCNVVTPNTSRSSQYVLDSSTTGDNLPGIQAIPLLFDRAGGVVDATSETSPALRATVPPDGTGPILSVNGALVALDSKGAAGDEHVLAMNLETPRAHTVNQGWTITFEGVLPRLGTVSAELRATGPEPGLYDGGARFCDAGVQSRNAVLERLQAEDPDGGDHTAAAERLADRMQITNLLPAEDDDYWDSTLAEGCSFSLCRGTFGDDDSQLPARDFPIVEAYDDRLLVDDPGDLLGLSRCCFPTYVSYVVRPGNQWVVVGQGSGFLHDMITDPETGLCRPSCDPTLARMNGRALRTPAAEKAAGVKDGSPTAFINPMFRFAIFDGIDTSPTNLADKNAPQRDMQFQFSTTGAFNPLAVTLLENTRDIAPVGITFIPSTAELAITDGQIQGLLTVRLNDVTTARQFF